MQNIANADIPSKNKKIEATLLAIDPKIPTIILLIITIAVPPKP